MTQKLADSNNIKERVAMFAGTFDPFTRGHLDILRRGLMLFDKVVVCIGYNASKNRACEQDLLARKDSILCIAGHDPRVDVIVHGGLTVDAARQHGAVALLRGVRSMSDFDYESRLADINRRLTGIETVLIVADPRWAGVSSSVVRELQSYGADVSAFVPNDNEL